jgi:hypothetical protein
MSATLAAPCDDRLSSNVLDKDCPDDLVELALVLPRWQVEALASAARGRGMTAGQAVRRLVREFCAQDLGDEH